MHRGTSRWDHLSVIEIGNEPRGVASIVEGSFHLIYADEGEANN
jgi:hypothetical protein